MPKPQKMLLTCSYCGYQWLEPIESVLDRSEIIYRLEGEESVETTERRIPCSNPDGCPRAVIVTVPKAWTQDE